MTADLIHVCGLPAVPDLVLSSRARHLVTCLGDGGLEQTPLGIMDGRHLKLVMHDIDELRDGYTPPSEAHVADLLDFVGKWDRTAPMIIHCYAGISRSTAAAFIALCALNPRDARGADCAPAAGGVSVRDAQPPAGRAGRCGAGP